MKLTFLRFSSLLGSLLLIPQVHAQSCPNPIVNVSINPLPLTVSAAQSQRQIQAAGSSHGVATSSRQRTLGLYVANTKVSVNGSMQIQQGSDKLYYACMPQVDISLTYSQIIYLANELPTNSCSYRVAYEHEMTHSHIQEAALRQALPAIRNLSIHGGNYAVANTQTQARQALQAYQQWVLESTNLIQKSYVEPAQARLDTPENYAAETQKCGAETQRILQSLR